MTVKQGHRRSVVSNRVCVTRCGAWLMCVALVAVIGDNCRQSIMTISGRPSARWRQTSREAWEHAETSRNKCGENCGRPSAEGGEKAKSWWLSEALWADEDDRRVKVAEGRRPKVGDETICGRQSARWEQKGRGTWEVAGTTTRFGEKCGRPSARWTICGRLRARWQQRGNSTCDEEQEAYNDCAEKCGRLSAEGEEELMWWWLVEATVVRDENRKVAAEM